MTLDIAGLAATPTEAPAVLDRSAISVLGIRRRYWEMTHGWAVPADAPGTAEIDIPSRVA